uniref:Gastrin domain-containing protein n=1 Tax=Globodera pallida TaxID=36090 RepID=A0A183BK80_GLOPA
MAPRLSLCVLIVLCVSQLANGDQPALELNALDALAIQKQRGAQFGKDVDTAVEKKLLDGTGTGEPMTPSTGSGGTKSSGKSTPAGSTDQPPPSFGTTKAPGQKDAFAMTPLNRVLAALIALNELVSAPRGGRDASGRDRTGRD